MALEGTITALRLQKKNSRRVNVYLDGEFAFGLAAVVAAGLKVGQRLTADQVAELQRQDAVEQAYQRALRWLARRPHAEGELRDKFRRAGVEAEVAETALDRLRQAGLVDDLAFARAWVENRLQFRPRSAAMLRAELRQKGVDRQVIEQALADFDDGRAAYLAARAAGRRWKDLSFEDFRRRLGGYLARRGFAYPIISPVVTQVWREVSGHGSEE